ncbi:MAG: hypothetical protein ACFFCC_11695 [Promethearchaeota archaeon]
MPKNLFVDVLYAQMKIDFSKKFSLYQTRNLPFHPYVTENWDRN